MRVCSSLNKRADLLIVHHCRSFVDAKKILSELSYIHASSLDDFGYIVKESRLYSFDQDNI